MNTSSNSKRGKKAVENLFGTIPARGSKWGWKTTGNPQINIIFSQHRLIISLNKQPKISNMGWQTWNHFENDSSYKFKSDSCVTNLTVLNHLWFLSLFTGTHTPSVTYSHVTVTKAYWCRGVALSAQIQRATPSSDVIFCNSEQLLWISKHSKNMIKHCTVIPQFMQ